MRMPSPSEIKPLIVETPVPMNETQRQLQAVLDYWGPNGDGFYGASPSGYSNARYCTVWCLLLEVKAAAPGDPLPDSLMGPLNTAAMEQGYRDVIRCNDSGFHNARKMVLRAIELAA